MAGVFTNPLLLTKMANMVYNLTRPLIVARAPPLSAANNPPTTPTESVHDGVDDGTLGPSSSTAGVPTAGKGRASLPTTPVQTIEGSDAESDTTEDLEPKEDPSYSAPVLQFKSDHALRKWTCQKSDESKDSKESKDNAPPPRG